MAIINQIKEIKRTELGEQYFIGEVVDINDPKKLGRVRIRVNELFGTKIQIPDAVLPWAAKEDNHFLGFGSKQFCIPRVGARVSVYFSKGDIYSPIYTGELQSQSNYDPEQEESYGDLYLKKDRNGSKIKDDVANKILTLVYNGKVVATITDKITINAGADVEITISAKLTESVGTDKSSTIGGDSTEIVTGNKEITAAKVKITAPVEITGNVTITGTLTSGAIASPAATIGGKPFATHTHSNVTPGPGTTGPIV
jgi:phage baseplate assembly protein gpV